MLAAFPSSSLDSFSLPWNWRPCSRTGAQMEGLRSSLGPSRCLVESSQCCEEGSVSFIGKKGSIRGACVYACSVSQLCQGLCDPLDCSLPGSFVHGILQARILEWVATPFSRGSSWPRDWTQVSCVSCTDRQVLYHWVTGEVYQRHLQLWKGKTGIRRTTFPNLRHRGENFKRLTGTSLVVQWLRLQAPKCRGPWLDHWSSEN